MGESQVFGSSAIFAWQANYAFMLSECLRALASHKKLLQWVQSKVRANYSPCPADIACGRRQMPQQRCSGVLEEQARSLSSIPSVFSQVPHSTAPEHPHHGLYKSSLLAAPGPWHTTCNGVSWV